MKVRLITSVALFSVLISAHAVERPFNVTAERPLPQYTYPYDDGLYATIAGYLKIKDVPIKGLDSYKLKVDSFEKKMPVKAVIQRYSAPLVVVLLGINGHTDADFSRLWASWYADNGYHVLLFDSTFRPSFVNISGHGVSGNIWRETERVGQIIHAFTDQEKIRGKISQIGVVGMSYGGTQALILGRLAKEGKLPFEIAGIQAYSPPLRAEWTATVLDRWYEQERPKYTLVELQEKVASHKPSNGPGPAPMSESIMKAAIAASFREGLPDVILRNDEYFHLNLIPRGDMFDDSFVRKDHAERWGYSKFAFDMSLPYWQDRLGNGAVQQMIEDTRLSELLKAQPAYSETIVTEDDPFNNPNEVQQLRAEAPQRLTLLPHGGHLGYIAEPWTQAKLLNLFANPLARLTYSERK